MLSHKNLALSPVFAAVAITTMACEPSSTSPTPVPPTAAASSTPAPSSEPLSVPPIDASTAAVNAQAASAPHVYHYDLVITGPNAAKDITKVSLDVSDASPGSVSFGKNVMIAAGARSDVGSNIKATLTMKGETPQLELDANIATLDAGKVRRIAAKGSAATPVGAATTVVEATQEGKQYRISATPSTAGSLGGAGAAGNYAVDVATSHTSATPGGGAAKKSQFTLMLNGDTPGISKQGENVPLQVTDGGAVARQDTGIRVKAVGHPRAIGLDIDFDLEMSASEGGAGAVTIRKVTARGPIAAPFDKATTAFTAEENGHRYEVTLTPHRATK